MNISGPVEEIGPHWVEIGFQNSNPQTDIRGGGLLGPLLLLYILENFPNSS